MWKLYVSYGSNMNRKQMAHRCPSAQIAAYGYLANAQLLFTENLASGCFATVEPCEGSRVPVVLWLTDDISERRLDVYEGFPHFYRKEFVNGDMINVTRVFRDLSNISSGYIYRMNYNSLGIPTQTYVNGILEAYKGAGFDKRYVTEALERSRAALYM